MKKRFLSSPWSFARTLQHYTESDGGLGIEADDEDQYYQEVLGSGQSDEEEGDRTHPEFTPCGTASVPTRYRCHGQGHRGPHRMGHGYQNQPDARLTALITVPGRRLPARRQDLDQRTGRRVHRVRRNPRLDRRVLDQHGYREGDRLAVIQGSTPPEEREYIRAQFTAPPDKQPVRVLVATDSAGEGIDLQTYCHRLVNFDIPFNPSRLEQRIGRIDRYGQRADAGDLPLAPDRAASAYAADLRFLLARCRRRSAGRRTTSGRSTRSSTPRSRTTSRPAAPAAKGEAVRTRRRQRDHQPRPRRRPGTEPHPHRTVATYGERKAEMHLTPGERSARRGHGAGADQPAAAEVAEGDTTRRSSSSRARLRRGSSPSAAWRPG